MVMSERSRTLNSIDSGNTPARLAYVKIRDL